MDVRFEGGNGVIPPPQWQDAGPVTARGALEAGTTLTLRVFNANGNDLERPEVTWPPARPLRRSGRWRWPARSMAAPSTPASA